MKKFAAFLFAAGVTAGAVIALCSLDGCSAAQQAQAKSATATVRGAVAVAEQAWVLAARGCEDVIAASEGDAGAAIEAKCIALLAPAHKLIDSADTALDAGWSSNAACDLAKGVALIVQTVDTLTALKGDLKPVAADALALANDLLGSSVCAVDAGAE